MHELVQENANLFRKCIRQRSITNALADIYNWLDGGRQNILKDPKFLEEHHSFITKDFLKEFKISLRKFKKLETRLDESSKQECYRLPCDNVRFFASLLPEERRQWYLKKK